MCGKTKSERRGAVTVETALCLPIMFMLFFFSVDLIRYNLLSNVISQATYEGARTALVRGATVAEVEAAISETVSAFDSDLNYDLTVTPTPLDPNAPEVVITVSCDMTAEGWVLSKYMAGQTLQQTMVLRTD